MWPVACPRKLQRLCVFPSPNPANGATVRAFPPVQKSFPFSACCFQGPGFPSLKPTDLSASSPSRKLLSVRYVYHDDDRSSMTLTDFDNRHGIRLRRKTELVTPKALLTGRRGWLIRETGPNDFPIGPRPDDIDRRASSPARNLTGGSIPVDRNTHPQGNDQNTIDRLSASVRPQAVGDIVRTQTEPGKALVAVEHPSNSGTGRVGALSQSLTSHHRRPTESEP